MSEVVTPPERISGIAGSLGSTASIVRTYYDREVSNSIEVYERERSKLEVGQG